MFRPNLKFVALPVPEIAIGFWVGVANPNLGEEEVGDGTVRKSVRNG